MNRISLIDGSQFPLLLIFFVTGGWKYQDNDNIDIVDNGKDKGS